MSLPVRLEHLGILISGRGTNMVALIKAAQAGLLSADIRVVLANRPDAAGLDRARDLGVPVAVVDHRQFASREDFDEALVVALKQCGVEWVALAGFMRVLTPVFLQQFPGRVLNIHPALLPAFPGTHAQRQAILAGVRETGCSVHFVDEGCDTGPVVAQARVPVLEGDDEDTLSARILAEENLLYPMALEDVLTGRVRLVAGRVVKGA